ncbi:hypothetical protein Leryth_026587 [Lithospermum erythrorhizon]|nr:hypothetical protein Leryth_026587 [Lithospermum erythrorhizon]
MEYHMNEVIEGKGLDMVRRVWSMLAKEVGDFCQSNIIGAAYRGCHGMQTGKFVKVSETSQVEELLNRQFQNIKPNGLDAILMHECVKQEDMRTK